MGKLSNRLLNNPWIEEEITKEIRNYVELNENDIKHIKTETRTVLRGIFIVLNDYSSKTEKWQTDDLSIS